jgi:hypothetical protein
VSQGSEASQSLSILSPFDEQEEWSKISQIINSFGADIGKATEPEGGRERKADGAREQCSTPHNSPVYEYPTLKRREKLSGSLEEWLRYCYPLNCVLWRTLCNVSNSFLSQVHQYGEVSDKL